ncbi:epsin-1 isoform X4 [Teleopsis dalmanni]|nr:epsin-1 isoform X4 [Teleopsis dalmanni]
MQVNVAGLRRNIKNLAHNYSDAQVKVREATSNDPWGPSATIMAEIADLTYNVVAFSEIMQMIWKRLNDHGKNWRHVYKALILLEYLIKTGTEKVAQQCKENIFAIQTLREFTYFEEGKDQGTHVREKAKQLVNLLKDDERLKNERVKALKAKERFAQHPSGFGSDGYIDGPLQRDLPPGWQEEPTKPVSELEMVRPQTAGEEELQLQLAMAMSREEAEQEEAKRRSDDVRLQLALSQSEQDFKDQTVKPIKEEPQSHLLDLLDISLGAASISSPPLVGAGIASSDPWGTPARAASQLSDPWSGTSSPPIDPWQPAGMRSNTAPLGAVGGGNVMGMNGDAWALRTQSPSVASGSSTEGWLHSNGAGLNGNANVLGATAMPTESWISKTTVATVAAVPPNPSSDPWLSDGVRPGAAAPASAKNLTLADPWAPKANVEDPWKNMDNPIVKKPSPDMDEFDIITNRNKTGDILTNNSISGPNNNNSSLLDEMDPLSTRNTASSLSLTNSKKPLKNPQAFLGENSALVNLDNLIKPVAPQGQTGNMAYNPFSDTVLPPKTNLFQQQQPAVPSINQLKQQQPFTMTVNQDPWAPVANSNANSQPYSQQVPNVNVAEGNIDRSTVANSNTLINTNANYNLNSSNRSMPYSRSDYDVFNTAHNRNEYHNYNMNNNYNNNYANSNQNFSHSVDNIRNMQVTSNDEIYATPLGFTTIAQKQYQYNNQPFGAVGNIYAYNENANSPGAESNFAASYSSALSASLAETPGVKISPFTVATNNAFNIATSATVEANNLLNIGFCDQSISCNSSTAKSNVDNNNMPWIKPEAAASNPFLS